ncbi:Gfo/Idh/MocA family oxidoreductase [Prosthecochloris sp. SCSIO W1101]|uniref:Gfo/Idh/MocA family protein n=1 Tax=Prosthecochloris sp. SCSIO W1101 TaxID=2992242 RepID=UPI00223D0275|nr:Gfo/Idh/MocA family oxidoreductase [Prosthecochloris sp. SCSIO W1101]UZJ41971.1 Gfo/Idh/MocA family oxidoreductase [Prosthecochloris sp. SCSIO W1101]
MKKEVKTGIIGAGRMGITHYSIINSHPEIKISSIADPSRHYAEYDEEVFTLVKTFKDYHELFKKDRPDAVLVCTPPDLHNDILKTSLDHKAHVFVEKPYTTDPNQAVQLAQLFEDEGLVNQVGYVNRFNDIFKEVSSLLKKNVIGRAYSLKSEMFSCTIVEPDDGSGWRGSREKGGGAVYEMAAHAIDLVNYLVGKPDKVSIKLNSIYSKKVEDAVSSTFVYKNGCSGTIYVNWSDTAYRKPTNKIELFGTKGKILADQHSYKIYCNQDEPGHGFRKGWNTRYITDVFQNVPFYVRGNEFTRQLYHFVDCIQTSGTKNLCSFRDGADAQEVIHRIFKDNEINGKA